MTRIGKILAIFVAVASLSFVGFAVATVFGGPDWQSIMAADYFNGYRITKSAGPEATWTAIRGSDEQQVASSKVLPEVLSKVMDEIIQNNTTRMQELQSKLPILEARIAELDAARQADKKALDKYVEFRAQELEKIRAQESDLATQVVAATNEAQKLENLVEARREDILRLKQQVEELRVDLFRLKEIDSQLNNLQAQIEGNLQVAKLRQKLLQDQTSK
ncbi:MAG: hypothetical protein KDA80_04560 [Planctomycetaceae bacterium]|nr:hypothetical protein [Planctomycetaceae bacterium]